MSFYKKNRLKFVGKKFGNLAVLQATEKRTKSGNVIYECICDCGNKVFVSSSNLRSGNTISCGCHLKKIVKETVKNNQNLKFGTNIEYLQRALNDNTSRITKSGIKGVSWNSRQKKWKTYITFQKKCYYLGCFDNIENAKQARKTAEKEIFGNFLEWYNNNFRK